MSTRHGVAKGALSLGGVRIVSNILSAVTLLVLAKFLTPQDFGIVAIASAVLFTVLSLTQISIFQALIQRPDNTREHIDTAWTISLIRTLLIAGFFLLASWPLSIAYHQPALIPVFLVTGVTGAMSSLSNPHLPMAAKKLNYWPLTIFQLLQKNLNLVTAIILAIILKSYWAIIIGNAIGASVSSLASYFILPYRPRLTLSRAGDLKNFTGWLFLSQLCETINWRFDQLFVSLFVSRTQMGHYAMADSLAVIPTRETIQPLREALFSGLARVNDDIGRLAETTMRAQAVICMMTMPLGLGLALVAGDAVRVVLGDVWTPIIPFVEIFSLGYAISSLTSCFAPSAMALGETKWNFLQQFSTMLIRIPLIVTGLFAGGLVGAALARLACDFVQTLITLQFTRKIFNVSVRRQLASHVSTLLGLCAMIVTVLSCSHFLSTTNASGIVRLLALTTAGGVAYCSTIFALWLAGSRHSAAFDELVSIAARFVPKRPVPPGLRT